MVILEDKKRLLIIDSNSLLHRAFHALPHLTTKKGELVNALYGFLLVFLKVIREIKPNYVVAVFDLPGPTFRHKKFKEYKIKRPPTPEGIIQQLPKIKEILKTFNVMILEKQGFEADDIIATIVAKTKNNKEIETIILSGDSDVLPLANQDVKVCFLKKGVKDIVLYDEDLIKQKYKGLTPEQLIDFKALKGDVSDNIPGVAGIGEKTALDLILKFGNLENLYQEIEKNSAKSQELPQRLKEILLKNKQQSFLSKELVSLHKNVPLDFDFKKCEWQGYDKEKIIPLFKEFEFYSLIKRISEENLLKKELKNKTLF